MVETRPLGCGWLLFLLVGLSLSFSPQSDCISLPSMMTWAPCPHGVRTRGKKLSQACDPMTLKLCGSVSVTFLVELRQPRANSLAVGCDSSSLGEGLWCRVNSARLIQPLKRWCPNLVQLPNQGARVLARVRSGQLVRLCMVQASRVCSL